MPTPLPTHWIPLFVGRLIYRWTQEGYVLGIDHHLKIQQWLGTLDAIEDQERLRNRLAPLLVHSPEQQLKFYQIFQEEWRAFEAQQALEIQAAPTIVLPTPDPQDPNRSLIIGLGIVGLVILLLGIFIIGPLLVKEDTTDTALPINPATVAPPPSPQLLSLIKGDHEVEIGGCARLRATYSGGTPPYSIQWQPEGLFPAQQEENTQACGITQDTTIRLIVADDENNQDTAAFRIRIKVVPQSSTQPVKLPRYELPLPDLSSLIVKDTRPAWKRILEDHATLFQAFFSLILLVLTGLLILWSRRRRPLVARRDKGDKPPYRWTFDLEVPEILATNDRILTLAQQMRGREESDAHQLNLPATVQASIRKAGRLQPIYRAQTRPTEYLLLIDRKSSQNHQAQLFNLLYETFKAQEIYARRYYYSGDPRVCWNEESPSGITLPELKNRYPDHRLLIFGTGYAFLSQRKGTFTKWASLIDAWEVKALLSPIPVEAWGRRELILGRKFQMMPTGLTGLRQVVEVLEKDTPTSPKMWKELSLAEEQKLQVDGENLIESLRKYFDVQTLEWIAACALWTSVHWDLTLFLGRKVKETYAAEGESTQLELAEVIQIARIPWFVEGEIPVEAKKQLLDYLPEARQNALRAEIYTLMEGSQPELDSVAFDDFRMHIVSSQLSRTDLSRAERRAYEQELAQLLEDDVEPDFSVIEYLDRPQTQLDFLIPANLRHLVYHKGKPFYGWKEWIWAGPLALVLMLGVWLGIPAIEGDLSIPDPFARISPGDAIITDLLDELAITSDERGQRDREAQDLFVRAQVLSRLERELFLDIPDESIFTLPPYGQDRFMAGGFGRGLYEPYRQWLDRSLDTLALDTIQKQLLNFTSDPYHQLLIKDTADFARISHFFYSAYINKHSLYKRNDSLASLIPEKIDFSENDTSLFSPVDELSVNDPLSTLADFMRRYKGYSLILIGYSDFALNDTMDLDVTESQIQLAKGRSQAVTNYLIRQGIEAERMVSVVELDTRLGSEYKGEFGTVKLELFYSQDIIPHAPVLDSIYSVLVGLQPPSLVLDDGPTVRVVENYEARAKEFLGIWKINARRFYNEAARIYEMGDTATARKFVMASFRYDSLPYALNLLARLDQNFDCAGSLQASAQVLQRNSNKPIPGATLSVGGLVFTADNRGQLSLTMDTCGIFDELMVSLKHPNHDDVRLTLQKAIELEWRLEMVPKEEGANVGSAEGDISDTETYDTMNLTIRIVDADDRSKGITSYIFGYREDEYILNPTETEGNYSQVFTTATLTPQDTILAFHDPVDYEEFAIDVSRYFAPDGKFKAPNASETFRVGRRIYFQIGVKDAETGDYIDDSPDIRYAQGSDLPRSIYFDLIDNGEYFYGTTTYAASKRNPVFEVAVPGYVTQRIEVDTFTWGGYPDNQIRFDVYLKKDLNEPIFLENWLDIQRGSESFDIKYKASGPSEDSEARNVNMYIDATDSTHALSRIIAWNFEESGLNQTGIFSWEYTLLKELECIRIAPTPKIQLMFDVNLLRPDISFEIILHAEDSEVPRGRSNFSFLLDSRDYVASKEGWQTVTIPLNPLPEGGTLSNSCLYRLELQFDVNPGKSMPLVGGIFIDNIRME
ncbi:MAG: hypothetical protein AAFU33_03785 [Bacteroidota bacterium]